MKKSFLSLLFVFLFLNVVCKSPTGGDDDNEPDTHVPGYTDDTFFKTDGQEILNRQGEPVIIKGFGLGGWLLPEGYMFGLNREGYTAASDIYKNVADLIGTSETQEWIKRFRDNYVTEEDIILMKEWGADHIRVPFHYNLFYDIDQEEFIDEGFERIDQLLIWCKRNRVDVILDMHAAPGAQSDGDIADSDGEARLWTERETYWPITIKVWQAIAQRYKDETIIIGYDLINEPVTPFEVGIGNPMLKELYSQLTKAIRAIDKNHILFIEGNYWATTFDYLTPPFDDNMVYAFHKYWNATDQGTIQYLLNIRSQYNTPLWLGESGENSNPWFYETIRLVEDLNIGWNWWTHKKLNTITSPLSAPTNPNYEKVKEYWNGNGIRPSAQDAKDGLFQMAEDLKLSNSTFRPDVVAALFSPSFGSNNEPYTELKIPGEIPAVHYDIGMNGISYFDKEYKRVDSDGKQNSGNVGWEFRNDGVDIQSTEDSFVEYNVGWLEDGEWLEYTVNVTAGTYDMIARVAAIGTGGRIGIYRDGKLISNAVNVPETGGYQSWQSLNLGSYAFEEGTYTIRIAALSGGFNLSMVIIK